jgi:AcrR family transcriptional regulator
MTRQQMKPARVVAVRGARALPSGRRERKKTQLRQRIIDTAIKMFRERGYDNTRIDDINESLDISRTTFFRYFPSKDMILRDFVDAVRLNVLKTALSGDAPARERLCNFYLTMAQTWQADQSLARAMIMTGITNLVRSPGYRERYNAQFGPLLELLAEGQRRHEITQDFTVRQLTIFLESLTYSVMAIWTAGVFGPDELVKQTDTALKFFLRRAEP